MKCVYCKVTDVSSSHGYCDDCMEKLWDQGGTMCRMCNVVDVPKGPPLCSDCSKAVRLLDSHGLMDRRVATPAELLAVQCFIRNHIGGEVKMSQAALMLVVIKCGVRMEALH